MQTFTVDLATGLSGRKGFAHQVLLGLALKNAQQTRGVLLLHSFGRKFRIPVRQPEQITKALRFLRGGVEGNSEILRNARRGNVRRLSFIEGKVHGADRVHHPGGPAFDPPRAEWRRALSSSFANEFCAKFLVFPVEVRFAEIRGETEELVERGTVLRGSAAFARRRSRVDGH
jgi:hypothetical protein